MAALRGLSCVGVLAIACTTEPASSPAEPPPILPIELHGRGIGLIEREPAEDEITSPEQLLGLSRDHPRVGKFVGDRRGIDFDTDDDQLIEAVYLFERENGFEGFLPGGIHFGDGRDQVHRVLGAPDSSSSSGVPWDKWYRETWSLLVTYDDGGVFLVQFVTARADPQRQP